MANGKLIVVSGPSGAGKGTLIKCARKKLSELSLVVSCTTRSPRPGEEDGVDYRFVSVEEFERRIAADEFLEYAKYAGNYYGTPRESVEPRLALDEKLVLEVDVQGALQIMEKRPEGPFVFILPPVPMVETLRSRLAKRGQSPASIEKRLRQAIWELKHEPRFHRTIVNDDLETAKLDFTEYLLRHLRTPAAA